MSKELCEYHPSKIAHTKCDRCNRMICLSDKVTVKTRGSTGFGENRMYYPVEYTFCPICKHEAVLEGQKTLSKFSSKSKFFLAIPLGFMVIMIFVINAFINSINDTSPFPNEEPSPLFFMLPLVLLGSLLMFGLLRSFTGRTGNMLQAEELRSSQQKEAFLATVENQDFLKRYKENQRMICNQCETSIPIDSAFCMSCGDSTKDERARLG